MNFSIVDLIGVISFLSFFIPIDSLHITHKAIISLTGMCIYLICKIIYFKKTHKKSVSCMKSIIINRDALSSSLDERNNENDLLKEQLKTSLDIISVIEQTIVNAATSPTTEEKQQLLNLHKILLEYQKFLK